MQKRNLQKIIILCFFLLIVVFVVLISAVDSKPAAFVQESKKSTIHSSSLNSNIHDDWTFKMSKFIHSDFFFPVNDLFITIDNKVLENNINKNQSIRLDFNNDRYSLFCVTQVLTDFSFPYTVVKDENVSYIYITHNDKKKLNKISKELEKYNIKTNFKEVSNENSNNL